MMVEALHAKNFEELHAIHEHKYNIAFLDLKDLDTKRPAQYLDENFEKIPSFYKCIVSKEHFEDSIEELNNLYYIMDDTPEKESLINLVKTLVSNFADVTDSPELGVSLEKVEGDLCKYFHCDMNHLRLVCPLLGPGTLWLEEDNVRREHLGKGKNEMVVIDQARIHQAQLNSLTLLKGQGHPTALGKAVVHASPAVSSTRERRVLLRIESIF